MPDIHLIPMSGHKIHAYGGTCQLITHVHKQGVPVNDQILDDTVDMQRETFDYVGESLTVMLRHSCPLPYDSMGRFDAAEFSDYWYEFYGEKLGVTAELHGIGFLLHVMSWRGEKYIFWEDQSDLKMTGEVSEFRRL